MSTRPATGASTSPSLALLLDDGERGLCGGELVDGDVIGGARLVELALAGDALLQQLLGAVEIGIRLGEAGIGLFHGRFGGKPLQTELVVDDAADHGTGRDLASFSHLDRAQRAADARPRRHHGPRPHLAEHGLHFGNGNGLDNEVGGARRWRGEAPRRGRARKRRTMPRRDMAVSLLISGRRNRI